MQGNTEPDYVTVNAATQDGYFNVVVMRWNQVADTYQVHQISRPILGPDAERLARSWAAAMGNVEIR